MPIRLWSTVVNQLHSPVGLAAGRWSTRAGAGCVIVAMPCLPLPLPAAELRRRVLQTAYFRLLQAAQIGHDGVEVLRAQLVAEGRHLDARLDRARVGDPAPQVLVGVVQDPGDRL